MISKPFCFPMASSKKSFLQHKSSSLGKIQIFHVVLKASMTFYREQGDSVPPLIHCGSTARAVLSQREGRWLHLASLYESALPAASHTRRQALTNERKKNRPKRAAAPGLKVSTEQGRFKKLGGPRHTHTHFSSSHKLY